MEVARGEPQVPRLSLPGLVLRFLGFGLLAWGGPIAQIAMLRRELVDEERWISSERFNRTLAVYQALPGPEAQELTVFFGTLSRGRIGGLLAGLCFLLPGFLLMLALAWFYVEVGIDSPLFAAALAGCQAAVLALIARGTHRIGARALTTRGLWAIAGLALVVTLSGTHFAVPLATGGVAYLLADRRQVVAAVAVGVLVVGLVTAWAVATRAADDGLPGAQPEPAESRDAGLVSVFGAGLQAGALTFGGAYTAIPVVQDTAVRDGGWLSDAQFLDGVALSGVIPAPMVIFATFVGYLAAGPAGAVVITLGVFLPAFAMTLAGHRYLERLVEDRRIHALLDGVTAAVVGLVAATLLQLAPVALGSAVPLLIFAAAVAVLYLWRSPAAVPVVMVGAGLLSAATAVLGLARG
ncbi:MAG TPA: chromate efflux transporter [Candidatus Limnocylindria bacterium]|nr:chromate efflux transporter [Candidatus Limnocylindria bacterium]